MFGQALDNDDFKLAKSLLAQDCQYNIGEDLLIGPDQICSSYEQNMIEGRQKLDELKWGESEIEKLNEDEFIIHFTDYLYHQGQQHTHRCEQMVFVNNELHIESIKHIHNRVEEEKLDTFYRKVNLK